MDKNTTSSNTETTSDERLLGMLAHLSVLFGGLILPVILWATQKDKSKFVTYNSLLAIFFHIAYIVLIVALVILMALFLIISGVGFNAFNGSSSGSEMPAFMIIGMIVFYAGLFLFVFAGIGYGIYLGVKTYQGNLVKIPFISSRVYKHVYGNSN